MQLNSKIAKVVLDATVTKTAAQATAIDLATDQITISDHGFSSGDVVGAISSTTLPTGISANTAYYVIKINEDTIALATSRANALAALPQKLNITALGSGTMTLRKNAMGTVLLDEYISGTQIVTDVWVYPDTAATSGGTAAMDIKIGSVSVLNATVDPAGITAFDKMTSAGSGDGKYLAVGEGGELTVTIATAALTDGKLTFWIAYTA